MAKLNRTTKHSKAPLVTHEGGNAKRISAYQELRRSVLACLLWEGSFYESGEDIATRISELVPKVKPEEVASLAVEARTDMKLRHVPLLLVKEMAKNDAMKPLVSSTLSTVVQRADELTEFLAMYWKEGRTSISNQVKKGLASAFTKFNEYQLAKYDRDTGVRLRDVLFLCHPKPVNYGQKDLWERLASKSLQTPDTWEVALSSGADKKATWERLLKEKNLGALALLRNLRNMEQVSVPKNLIKDAILSMKVERVLPYRFIAASKYAPDFEPYLETAMFKSLEGSPKFAGRTVLLVDVSGSMDDKLSAKSDLERIDAACGLAMLARELCEDVSIYSFSDSCVKIPARRGFALTDAIQKSQRHSCTYLGRALDSIKEDYDRIIVITDEQVHDSVGDPKGKGYMINVASYQRGVGYGEWNHIDGWSEAVLDYIIEVEKEGF